MKKGYYAFLVGTLLFDVIFFLICVVCIFARIGSPLEWIIYIIMDLTVGFPSSIRLFAKYKAIENNNNNAGDNLTS